MKRVIAIVISMLLVLSLAACGSTKQGELEVDYDTAEAFESALNAGENLEGKTVKFIAQELHPESALGYDIWAGEHLNFVSAENPDIKAGDTVIAKAVKIENLLGSWIISYEKLDVIKGQTQDTQDTQESPDSSATSESSEPSKSSGLGSLALSSDNTTAAEDTEELALELVEASYYIHPISEYSDSAYITFFGKVYNPNATLKAEFPEVLATAKNGDGSILATSDQMGYSVMPDDTVTIVGTLSIPLDNITDGADIYFDVDWSDFTSADKHPSARTTDFIIDNISVNSGKMSQITGEITNNTEEEYNVNLSAILRKGDEVVYVANSFVDGCKPGKPKAFEISSFSEYPEHDTVEISAQPW